jgi:hypothetical protein
MSQQTRLLVAPFDNFPFRLEDFPTTPGPCPHGCRRGVASLRTTEDTSGPMRVVESHILCQHGLEILIEEGQGP